MANTIQVRRGTAAELVGVALTQAELGYATDTDQVFIGDGAANHEFQMKGTLTTKGDIYAASAAATAIRLGIGANTFVLTADSAEDSGMKWAESSGSGAFSFFIS